jgi:polyhydroxyalkanoate synthesis regulator phasin
VNVTKKQLFAAALAVAAFAGAGAAIAASRPTPKDEQKAVIDDAAKQLGVAPDKLQSALQQALVNRVEQAVKDGRLTRAQADQLEARIKAGDVPLTPGFGYGGGPGFGHHGDRGGRGGGMLFGNAFQAAQSYLGVTDQQLKDALQSGKSLTDIAKDKGKTTAGLEKAMTDAITKAADQAVKDGKLTKDQRDALVSNAAKWVQHEIDETHDGHRGFGPGGPFGGPGGAPGGSGSGTGDGGQNGAGTSSGDILQST